MKAVFLFVAVIVLGAAIPVLPQAAPPLPTPPPPPVPRRTAYSDAVDKAADAAKSAVDDPVEDPKSTVRGRVVYAETGQPLRRAWIGFVKIRDLVESVENSTGANAWDYASAATVLTNDFGEFVMNDVGPGIYQPILRVPGILNPTREDRDNSVFQQFSFDGVSESQVEVSVRRGGTVSGRVLYQDGAPLIGGSVSLFKVKPGDAEEPETEALDGTTTDDRGYYRFAGIPEAEYFVMVAQPSVFDGSNARISSYQTSRYFTNSELKTFFPSSPTTLEASRLQLFPGEELQDIDVILVPRQLYSVSGLVVGARNNALVDGIEIEFRKEEEEENEDYQAKAIRTTTTDANARWKFKDLLPGKYVAKVSETSYRRYPDLVEASTRPNYATSEHKFEVTAGENTDVIFRIAVEASISGTISVEGNQLLPESITVYADTKTRHASEASPETMDYELDEPRQTTKTEFRLDDLAEGEYYINLKASEGFFAKSITYQGKNVLEQPIKIKAGEQLGNFQIVLTSGFGTVKGTLSEPGKSSATYAYLMPVNTGVSLFRSFLKADSEYLGDEGTFEFRVKPGEYYLFLKDDLTDGPRKNATPEELEVFVQEFLRNAVRVNVVRGRTETIDLKDPE